MKRQALFQNAMILCPACILIIGLFPGTMTVIDRSSAQTVPFVSCILGKLPDGTVPGGFLALLALTMVVTSVFFRVTGEKKSLDRVLMGSVFAMVIYWVAWFCYPGISVRFHISIFILLICELLFAVTYKIGKRLSFFV